MRKDSTSAVKSENGAMSAMSSMIVELLANKDASTNSSNSPSNQKSNFDFASAYQATQVATSKGIVYAEDLAKLDYVSTSLRKQIFEDVPERSSVSRCTSHDLSALLTRNVELTNTVSCLFKTSIAPTTRTQYECSVEDETHFRIYCDRFTDARNKLLQELPSNHPVNIDELSTNESITVLFNANSKLVANFILECSNIRREYL
ncbi:unnamed protein product [Mytilus coruscus]|uniref:Uncharacterized protein n=1 Tax=Mytilus coruscus TaxID=42192 RepID=A0A6J8CK11_MYTCO|nr:unnamed protein product [Mytilus coruscus]